MIDLRSDTVTKPTAAMRQAMVHADVGDDVFGEDPTVQKLQNTVADLLGKEAGLFVPSGVMGNQLALKIHTQPGDEVLLEAGCHIANYESGAPGLLSGVQLRPIAGDHGVLTGGQVQDHIRAGYYWEPNPRLVCLENTHNKAGGTVYPLATIHDVAEVVRERNLGFHLDGARLWHATAATGISEAEYAAPFDTISVCLSKGLGAPIGSVLVGPKELIQRAHRYRKMWGGGLRQVGIIAAAGLYALEHHRHRLAEDHTKARHLAEGIAALPAFSINLDTVQTNIVMFDTPNTTAETILTALKTHDVLMVPFGPKTIRATTHLDVSMDDIDRTLDVLRQLT